MIKSKSYIYNLLLIYTCYIIIALPQQSFGVSWPRISIDFNVNLDKGGFIISANYLIGAIASLLTGYLIGKYKTSLMVTIGFILLAVSVYGYSKIESYEQIIMLALPFGVACSGIAVVINSYAAHNLTPGQMNFLHGFWSLGAALGSAILTYSISHNNSWRMGYEYFCAAMIVLVIILMFSAKTWRHDFHKIEKKDKTKQKSQKILSLAPILSIIIFYVEAPIEIGLSLWLSTILSHSKGFSETLANSMVVVYWTCSVIGRFGAGFISAKIENRKMITYGMFGGLAGLLLLTFSGFYSSIFAVIIISLSISYLYPSMMHETSKRFSKKISPQMVGAQAAASLIGSTTLVPVWGIIITHDVRYIFPALVLLGIVMIISNKRLNKIS